jgi:hypothetical protein
MLTNLVDIDISGLFGACSLSFQGLILFFPRGSFLFCLALDSNVQLIEEVVAGGGLLGAAFDCFGILMVLPALHGVGLAFAVAALLEETSD